MAPNAAMPTGTLYEVDDEIIGKVPTTTIKPEERRYEIYWTNIAFFVYLHTVALYGLFLMFTSAKLITSIFAMTLYVCAGIGITAGVHRLWSHRSYKATWPLRLILALFNSLAFENSIFDWARDHRVHHKYSETDADPHNANRGFFFSHCGWLMCRKHPEVINKGKGIDVSDLLEDPIVMFQDKHYRLCVLTVCFVLPTIIPMLLWNETFINAFCLNIFRYVYTLNATWFVNSAAHMFGYKPYDKFISPSENLPVAIVALGEGWHNYHHTFPWDYKTSELGKYSVNISAAFIDFFSLLGWAYEMKTVSREMIKKRADRTGDGSHAIWGWGDKDQPKEDYTDAVIINKKD